MNPITQPLRDEHKEMFPHVESLRLAGDAVSGPILSSDARRLIEESYTFLSHHLIPHAQAEEQALYPVVQKVMGAAPAEQSLIGNEQGKGQAAYRIRSDDP